MNASRDDNNITALIGTLDTDGETIVRVLADPSTHALEVDDDTTGVDNGPVDALIDENGARVLMAVSSADGITPVAVYTDSNGNLLIDSN